MATIDRRTALRILGAAPAAAGFAWTIAEVETAQQQAQQAQKAAAPHKPVFFTTGEYAAVILLAEMILPADERSGGATEAGVPVFIDFMMVDQPARQVPMRGGLAWLDQECNRRFNLTFVAASDAQRRGVLDDISGPNPVRPEVAHGTAFFRSFRDLTATGFWTSKMGMADLRFMGNRVVKWDGCPPEALAKLGVSAG